MRPTAPRESAPAAGHAAGSFRRRSAGPSKPARWLFAAALCLAFACSSQPAAPTQSPDAAERVYDPIAEPSFLEQYAATGAFRLGRPTRPTVTPSGDAVLFLRSGPRSFEQELWSFDLATGAERMLASARMLLGAGRETLTAAELARRERQRMAARGIASFQLDTGGRRILIPLSGRLFVVERLTGRTFEVETGGGPVIDPRFSPNGKLIAFVRDGDLWVTEVEDGKPRRLTTRARETITNGLAEFVAQEEMKRHQGYWWNADSASIVFQENDEEGLESLHILDAANPFRPGYSSAYPRAGERNVRVRLGIVPVAADLEEREIQWLSWDRERYPYLAAVRTHAKAPLTVLVQNRLQTEQVLLAFDEKGESRTLLQERDPAWLNLDGSVPRWLPDGETFLWASESRGSWQLELRDRRGAVVRLLTPPEIGYRRLLHVDPEGEYAWIQASPKPTERHLYRVPITGEGEVQALTVDPGEHGATFSRSGVYVHTLSSATGELRFTVRHPDGSHAGELRSVAEAPPFTPNVEWLELPGPVTLHAAVVRPRNYQRGLHYPVILFAYGGPLHQTVTASRERWLRQQWFADHGFLVVSIDGRGTPGRGRDWERATHLDLLTLPLEDQVAGLRAIGERYAEFDLSRVGVFGWSFGGTFSAMAVMRHPEVFHAAVAVAPVSEWRDYDTHYTERYLGLPQSHPEAYDRSGLLHWAPQLSRPLLLIHGTADDNVAFSHSLRLSDVLFREGKAHDFLPLAGQTHSVHEPEAAVRLYERIVSYFQTHLGEPVRRRR